ncbi:MAG: AlkA N-terminal domain-containing protein [Ilumatobacteraceae bacterium]
MTDGPLLDIDRCYRAVRSRDRRFDGWFVLAVRTTGIYCRPSCPAVTPKRSNVEFHPTTAAAHARGFRACKRCRPDATPGSPEWDLRADVVARAVRLIADGAVDRDGVPGLARRLGYGERQLRRLLVAELGAGPTSLARVRRAETARVLLETTDLAMAEVAVAAGFGSTRQFNDTIRSVYATTPGSLRLAASTRRPKADPGVVAVRLPVRTPFAGRELVRFIGAHAVPGLEHVEESATGHLERTLALPHGHGVVGVTIIDDEAVRAEFRLADWRDLAPAVERVRRWLDLDADPVAIDAALSSDPVLTSSVGRCPGLRSPGSVDPFEAAIRTVIGQQVSVVGAATVTGRIVAALGEPLSFDHPRLDRVFPTPERLAAVDPVTLPLPRQRAATVCRVAQAVVDGRVDLDRWADRREVLRSLGSVVGVGPWTVDLVAMRGLGDPDVFPVGDLVLRRGVERIAPGGLDPDRWRPWRSYATRHIWNTVWSPR